MPFEESKFEKPSPSTPEEPEPEKGPEERQEPEKEVEGKREEELQERKTFLENLGFSEKTIEYLIVHYRPEGLTKKINNLKKAGFEKPVELIEKYPRLASYDIEEAINDLKKAGFGNPVESIKKFPPLAGYGIERVKRRIRILDRLIKLYNLEGISGIEIGESSPRLFSCHIERVHFNLRILKKMSETQPFHPQELIKKGKDLIIQNPYLIFSFLKERRPQNFEELRKILSLIKTLKKAEKNQIITEIKTELPKLRETLRESPDSYDKFLAQLAYRLQRLEKSKKEKHI